MRTSCSARPMLSFRIVLLLIAIFIVITGHRFRSVIDETWWAGEITDRSPFQTEFPDSHFQCFTVR